MLPSVQMECRAAADPELRFATSGTAVAKIRTVSSKRKKDDSGEWVDDKTCWLDVTCFGRLAENVAESVVKGDLLVVTGTLQTDEWTDKDTGDRRSKTECVAWTVAVSLSFRTVRHGEGRSERAGSSGPSQWDAPSGVSQPAAAGAQPEEPPF